MTFATLQARVAAATGPVAAVVQERATPPTSASIGTANPASPAQLRAIASIAEERGMSDSVLDSQLLIRWEIRQRTQLDRRSASECIDGLKSEQHS